MEDWIHVNPSQGTGGGTVQVTLDPNESEEDREGNITVSSNTLSKIISIIQKGMIFYTIESQDSSNTSWNLYKNENSTKTLLTTSDEYKEVVNEFNNNKRIPFYLLFRTSIISLSYKSSGSSGPGVNLNLGSYSLPSLDLDTDPNLCLTHYYVYIFSGYGSTPELRVNISEIPIKTLIETHWIEVSSKSNNPLSFSVERVLKGDSDVTSQNFNLSQPENLFTPLFLRLLVEDETSSRKKKGIGYIPLTTNYTFHPTNDSIWTSISLWGVYQDPEDKNFYKIEATISSTYLQWSSLVFTASLLISTTPAQTE